ncbi:hypothetical protein BU17DRAFT_57840 [Hysterangium stoloniferum]|nr:hypothetical protein BU17DRAFT_57840 [Hysterangium stoloniferum]
MPSVQPGSRVLVTGASGFVATWVVKTLLEQGFLVRGTVRSETKGDYLRKLFASYGEKFDYVIVEDISKVNWNQFSVDEIKQKGSAANPVHWYYASKVLAERAVWDFVEIHGKEVNWDVTILNPPLVWGPPIQHLQTPSSLNLSLVDFYLIIKGKPPSSIAPAENWVDVRDVAEGHVRALRVEEAGGERLIFAAGTFTWQSVLDAIHHPEPLAHVPRGTSGLNRDITYLRPFSNTKACRILGMQFRPLEVCARDTVKRLLELEGHPRK